MLKSEQLALELTENKAKPGDMFERVRFNDIHVSKSTFLNGLTNRVHRWFRLTPSFGPELVHEMIKRLDVCKNEIILDPFAGAGTTLIEAKMEGICAIGFEINPLLHFVNQTCLDWDLCSDDIRAELSRLKKDIRNADDVNINDLNMHGLSIPSIHNPTRWWRQDVLVKLVFLRRAIMRVKEQKLRNILLLALAGVLVPDLTNVTLGRLQLHFIDRTDHEIDVWGIYSQRVLQIADDIDSIKKIADSSTFSFGNAKCYNQDSLDISHLKLDAKISAVITSPPYPNRYSYVWNTRPHLYLLEMMETAKEASELDKKTIGGTWGSATSELAKGIIDPINSVVAEAINPTVSEIRLKDNLMANYVVHYFNRLSSQLAEMESILTENARLAYVVGNSRIKGVYVETDVILGKIIEQMNLGYRVFDIHRFRCRHSGVRLYESIVYATKQF